MRKDVAKENYAEAGDDAIAQIEYITGLSFSTATQIEEAPVVEDEDANDPSGVGLSWAGSGLMRRNICEAGQAEPAITACARHGADGIYAATHHLIVIKSTEQSNPAVIGRA
jgi:hypothetical protein